MRLKVFLPLVLLQPYATMAAPAGQEVLAAPSDHSLGVGHFSEWSRETKREFLIDWQEGRASEWTLVQGNEGGDLDSMTAALSWAYHLEHLTQNTSAPVKAIALLQTPTDALDLRPENKVALANSQMSKGHSDLLTSDELPEDPETLSRKIKGIVLVDHPSPLRRWDAARIISIFDHHQDRGAGPHAKPRIFEKTASCTTIVARQMLDELEALPEEYHMPHELLELMLGAIAIDSNGLKHKKSTEADVKVSQRILDRSNWHGKKLKHVMSSLSDELGDAKEDIGHLGVRDLLRRDWKGDLIDTPSPRTPTVNVGFASVPYSLDEQIKKTEFRALFDWFAVHAAWTAEISTDISVTLTKYKTKGENGKKQKIREIILVVRDDVRVDDDQADEIFAVLKKAIEEDPVLNAKPWYRADELGHRQMAWTQEGGGRKIVRPIIEKAVHDWD